MEVELHFLMCKFLYKYSYLKRDQTIVLIDAVSDEVYRISLTGLSEVLEKVNKRQANCKEGAD